jgi:hypothetical protein
VPQSEPDQAVLRLPAPAFIRRLVSGGFVSLHVRGVIQPWFFPAPGCDAVSRRLIGGASEISPVLLAVAGANQFRIAEKINFDDYLEYCLKTSD